MVGSGSIEPVGGSRELEFAPRAPGPSLCRARHHGAPKSTTVMPLLTASSKSDSCSCLIAVLGIGSLLANRAGVEPISPGGRRGAVAFVHRLVIRHPAVDFRGLPLVDDISAVARQTCRRTPYSRRSPPLPGMNRTNRATQHSEARSSTTPRVSTSLPSNQPPAAAFALPFKEVRDNLAGSEVGQVALPATPGGSPAAREWQVNVPLMLNNDLPYGFFGARRSRHGPLIERHRLHKLTEVPGPGTLMI